MFLLYKPGGQDEQVYDYRPNRMMSPEMELIEKLSGLTYTDFSEQVITSARCRRILLFILQKRVHPTLKFDDVSFAWDEVDLQYSREELEQMCKDIRESGEPDSDAKIRIIESEMENARSEEPGKAQPNNAD